MEGRKEEKKGYANSNLYTTYKMEKRKKEKKKCGRKKGRKVEQKEVRKAG